MVVEKPKERSLLRVKLGKVYYGYLRKLFWLQKRREFARTYQKTPLPHCYAAHKTPLRRKLKDVDMWMQENKVVNLRLAVEKLDGILLQPGETFSYWKCIGHPSARKGYLPGMILRNGKLEAGVGGGLCQLSNLVFFMALHTPLTVVERHRHGYDVFPDSDRKQPFGSGATCSYPHCDLMIRNDTEETYQLRVRVGEEYLEGQWRVSAPTQYRYEIEERNHEMRGEYWGGYTRHNEIWQKRQHIATGQWEETLAVQNSAIMMYSPFLEEKK